jgi:curli biogenesis system outer membrane secretion channel CsgG
VSSVLALILSCAAAAPAATGKIGVVRFGYAGESRWWQASGAEAAQDVFVTELVGSRRPSLAVKPKVMVDGKQLALSGDVDPSTAVKIGKLLGVNYLLTGNVTRASRASSPAEGRSAPFTATLAANLIDTSTGEIVWMKKLSVSVGGFGGGVDDDRVFGRRMRAEVMVPLAKQLTAALKAADL